MPPLLGVALIAGIGLGVAVGGITVGVLLGAAAITAVTYVVGLINAPDGFSLKLNIRDRQTLIRTPSAPRRIVYGEANLAPQILYLNSYDSGSSRYLQVVCSICDHPLAEIKEVILNGGRYLSPTECAFLTDGNLVIVSSDPAFTGKGTLRSESVDLANDASLGSPMRMIASLTGAGDCAAKVNPITDRDLPGDFKCTGMAWIYFQFKSTTDNTKRKPWPGLPDIQLRVRRGGSSLAGFGADPSDADPYLQWPVIPASTGVRSDGVRYISWACASSIFDGAVLTPLYFNLARPITQDELADAPRVQIGGKWVRLVYVLIERYPSLINYFRLFLVDETTGIAPDLDFPNDLRMVIYEPDTDCIIADILFSTNYLHNPFGLLSSILFDVQCFERYFFASGAAANLRIWFYQGSEPVADVSEFSSMGFVSADNASLCAYDYLSRYTTYGLPLFGKPRISDAAFAAASLISQARGWKTNGVITLDDSPDAVLTQFEQALIGGFIVDRGGIAEIRAGGPRPVSLTIDESEVLPEWSVLPSLPRTERASVLSISYAEYNPANGLDETRRASLKITLALAQYGERVSD